MRFLLIHKAKSFFFLLILSGISSNSSAGISLNRNGKDCQFSKNNATEVAGDGHRILTVNNYIAYFNADGAFFWDYDRNRSFIPKRDSLLKGTIFINELWIGGLDSLDTLHLSAGTYRSVGVNYWSGPLDENAQTDSTTVMDWNHIWHISKAEIDSVRADYLTDGIINRPVPNSVLTWPAKGNIHATGRNGIEVQVETELAPFIDLNENGIYEPLLGDYPKIRGDEMIWWVFNDAFEPRGLPSGNPLGIEVRVSIFGFDSPEDTIIYNTLFVSFQIVNKSQIDYHDLYMGTFTDFDLGCWSDDYLGSDTASNTYYSYNGDDYDGECGLNGYGSDLPIQTVTYLNERLGSFMYLNGNGGMLLSLPIHNPRHFYHNLMGHWKDGSPVEYGGNGSYQGTFSHPWMYSDSPSNPDGWSECAMGNPTFDRRGTGATGPFNFLSGDTLQLDIAFSFHRYPWITSCPDFQPLREKLDSLRNFYNNSLEYTFDSSLISKMCNDRSLTINVYPNPASDKLFVFVKDSRLEVIEVFDLLGRRISNYQNINECHFLLELDKIESGIYILRISTEDTISSKRIVVGRN